MIKYVSIPGKYVVVLNMMLHFIIKKTLFIRIFLEDFRTEGFDFFQKEKLKDKMLIILQSSSVDKQFVLKNAAIAFATARNSIGISPGVTEHEQGSKTLMLIADLA